jgi:lycopene cyclase CruA
MASVVDEAKTEEALAQVRARGGAELAERLLHLDRVRREREQRPGAAVDRALPPPDPGASPDCDVVMAGGGLSLLVAAELARLGLRVVVLERARAGVAHREWNASDPELRPLVAAGIGSEADLARWTVARYERGVCRFGGGASHVVRGALDVALDGGAFLADVRVRCTERGVRFVDGATVDGVGEGKRAVRVSAGGQEIVGRLFVDARGASSPHASADLVCPTVGGVVRGLRRGDGPQEIDPHTGEILVTIDDAARGAPQEVWEAFPGRPGETTVYLFTYEEAAAAATRGSSLALLYARFFAKLPSYKGGDTTLVRPTFGYIPGWSRLGPSPRAPGTRTVLVGDAAARHSPLTMCGFGSMVRSFVPVAARLARQAMEPSARTRAGMVSEEEPVHAFTGALARMVASRTLGPALNDLLDAAFGVLAEMGNDAYVALLQDRMSARDFTVFLRQTARRQPRVYGQVMLALGPQATARWAAHLATRLLLSPGQTTAASGGHARR